MTRLRLDGAALPPMLAPASCEVVPGALTVLLGPNGAGKTSLLRVALGLLRPTAGKALIDGTAAARMPARARARAVAYLPQARALAWPQSVRDVVSLGRFAHGGVIGRMDVADAGAVARALTACNLDALADRSCATLSGGELARVHCARALAAEAPMIVADEPVAGLDPLQQHQVMRVFRRHVDAGGGALVVLHDLDLAARYADRLVWMAGGAIIADGSVADTMTAARIAEIYGVRGRCVDGRVLIDGPA